MNLRGHVEQLKRRHQALHHELHEAISHPSTDDTTIHRLKQRKLHLKDKIAQLDPDSVH